MNSSTRLSFRLPSSRTGTRGSTLRCALGLLGLLVGCNRGDDSTLAPHSDSPGDSGGDPLIVSWGDLHAHSGLSHDGCEDPDALCLSDEDLPGQDFFENAGANGLAFAALTDHAESVTYLRPDDGVELDIWDREKELVAAAEGGPVIPILGYEWTADAHRTVLVEDPAACAAYRIPGKPAVDLKAIFPGIEQYVANPDPGVLDSNTLAADLAEAGSADGCTPSRVISYLHHTAETTPGAVDWTSPAWPLDTDTVVEIASEHGSSECSLPADEGCIWHLQQAVYYPEGATQIALGLGRKLGFVGGTDRHDADPGQLGMGPGFSAHFYDSDGDGVLDTPYGQYTTGTLTGVITPSPLTRAAIFDAITARHTYAASRVMNGLQVTAVGSDGSEFLPGDDIPAGTYTIHVELDDPDIGAWSAQLVAPSDARLPVGDVTFAAGDVWYVRLDATVDGIEERAWASPFFGT